MEQSRLVIISIDSQEQQSYFGSSDTTINVELILSTGLLHFCRTSPVVQSEQVVSAESICIVDSEIPIESNGPMDQRFVGQVMPRNRVPIGDD
ncbi:11263_t:CDS:2 [Ambispora leptoticha]|uniref:11263_t:CDS:1 n=1 Tax=Ambispora leptoticha TaxID=144679 RepID=A0A9N9F209_9GLOM|nr:11263_t:CDS:2 [Ambispora leptoticha]